jgi:hypothetical protein
MMRPAQPGGIRSYTDCAMDFEEASVLHIAEASPPAIGTPDAAG